MNRCLEHNVLNETFIVYLEREEAMEGYREYEFHITNSEGKEFAYIIKISDLLQPMLIEEKQVNAKTFNKEIMSALTEYIKDRLDDDYFQDSEFVFSQEDIDELEEYIDRSKRPRMSDTLQTEKMELLQYLRDAREELYGQEDKYTDFRIIQSDSGLSKNHLISVLRQLAEEGKVDLYESEIEDTAARITRKGISDLENL